MDNHNLSSDEFHQTYTVDEFEVELTGCRGIWTVYHKSTCSRNADLSKVTDDDEYHAYLIITLEARTMVYSKELKGAISALAYLQGHLLTVSGPIIMPNWIDSELNGITFYDAPPLYVVSLNMTNKRILRWTVLHLKQMQRELHGTLSSLLKTIFTQVLRLMISLKYCQS
ncbi:hypothetical protein QQP08_010822 [Theobroma cacao]|nr:hypothetical protein QQP08_010822 [Theobroma cacao]